MYEQAVDALASAIGVDIVLSKPDGLDHLVEMISGLIDPRGEQNNDRSVETICASYSKQAYSIQKVYGRRFGSAGSSVSVKA